MLRVNNLHKTFFAGTPNEVQALRGVDLSIDAGSFTIVIGTNGSGKSTLLNAVAGSFLPDQGTISIAGQDVTTWPEHRRARFIGRVFQNPFAGSAPNLSIAENMALAMRRGKKRGLGWALSTTARREFHDRIRDLNMGLEDRIENPIGTLSGGQRQALTLLMAGFVKPDVLLLDEHTAALDPKSADQVIGLTEKLIRRDSLTTLMVTHSMHQAAQLGDRIVMMVQGRVIHDFAGAEKQRLGPEDLLARFEEVRRSELLDESAAALLEKYYI